MKQLRRGVKRLQTEELIRANKVKPLFVDDHHAYGVIKEEIEEAERELHGLRNKLEMFFWKKVKNDDSDKDKYEVLERMRTQAMLGACEMIQVSAMCEKAMISISERNSNEDIHLG